MTRRPREITSAELDAARGDLVLRQLFAVYSAMRERFFTALADAGYPGLTMQHSLLLRNLPFEGTTMADVVRRAGASRQAIARIARDLEERGYLVIQANPDDARGVRLGFSKKGRVLARVIIDTARAAEADLERILGPRGLAQFRASLTRIDRAHTGP